MNCKYCFDFFAFTLLIPTIVFAVKPYNTNAWITFTISILILIAISVIIMSIFLLVYAIFILVNLDNNKQNTIFILMLLGILLTDILGFIAAIMIIKMKEPITEEKLKDEHILEDKMNNMNSN